MAPPSPPALRRLLDAAGYRVEETAGLVLAVRADDHRAVVIASGSRGPGDVERLFPADAVHRTIVYDDEPGETVRSAAAERGIELLAPSTLGPALGELLLPSALIPGSGAAGPGEDALDSPFPPVPVAGRIVRPRIGRREAQELAGLRNARYTLRLVPYFVAPYRVRAVSADGARGKVQRGLVAVSATSRRAEVWMEGTRDLVAEVDGPVERLAPQLTEAAAGPIAGDAIRRHHTVRVDHIEQHAGAIVVESRRVAPPGDAIRLGPFTLLFVPFWYAESTDGRRVLDAVSGRGAADIEADAPAG
jgi:hypothetical protein